jgi:enamine deaminase RidA (YjgF/YER057c/UK114 family)
VSSGTAALVRLNPPERAAPVGAYSQGVVAPVAGRWLHVSGQVGLRPDGTVPASFEEQAQVAWENLVAVLAAAGMDAGDLVKITSFLVDPAHVPAFARVRSGFLGEARPASTLLIVQALARPEWLVEVEALACRA